jgi:hypothetical protein
MKGIMNTNTLWYRSYLFQAILRVNNAQILLLIFLDHSQGLWIEIISCIHWNQFLRKPLKRIKFGASKKQAINAKNIIFHVIFLSYAPFLINCFRKSWISRLLSNSFSTITFAFLPLCSSIRLHKYDHSLITDLAVSKYCKEPIHYIIIIKFNFYFD